MKPDRRAFFRACNPAKTIWVENEQERKYYIDFSAVRGSRLVDELADTILMMDPDPTCQLFTGHIGCGKSTELLRLKAQLQDRGFHVVYFESHQDLDLVDVDITDILLAIARRISESLEGASVRLQPGYFAQLLQDCLEFLNSPVELNAEAELSLGIGKITARTRESPKLRNRLRDYLEPKTEGLLRAINQELLIPGDAALRQQGKAGLVAIVDNLDRVCDRTLPSGQSQAEYLFVNRGDQLRSLQCHLVYTIPLVLMFSNEREALKQRLGGGNPPMSLPMVPITRRDGQDCPEGLAQLRQMVLARAFPDCDPQERLHHIDQIFDSSDTLDQLCRISGGHVRNLLSLLFSCLRKQSQLPIHRTTLNQVSRDASHEITATITADEWALLHQVARSKKVSGEQDYDILLRSLFVFEYRNQADGRWFDLNPLVAAADELNDAMKPEANGTEPEPGGAPT